MNRIVLCCFTLLIAINSIATNYTVTNCNDSGSGSLREALTNANNAVGADNIYFNIPTTDAGYSSTSGAWTISLNTALPYITTGYITIDATSQTTNQGNTNTNGTEIIIKNNADVSYAFFIASPSNTVKGFTIQGFTYGVQVYGSMATQNHIRDCYIGCDYSGTVSAANEYGITFSNSTSLNYIHDCVISGNSMSGILFSETYSNQIYGNKIGTNASGTSPLPNSDGIILNNSYNNSIGITALNLISGNANSGITINGTSSYGNIIKKNYIGSDITGNISIENLFGIMLINSHDNTIGGSSSAESNTISGNLQSGIIMNGTGTEHNTVSGNFIGTNYNGTQALSNHVGILLKTNSNHNTIGGTTSGQRNIISANWEIGVYLESCDSNIIVGNYIGTDVNGNAGFTTGDTLIQGNGVEFNTVSRHNILGGYTAAERNIISGNRVYGFVFYGNSSENDIIGNYMGTDKTGSYSVPNATGICVDGGSNHNRMINNLLSGNYSYGIFIVTTGTYYNEFKGNLVGTNASGNAAIPNDAGLLIGGGARYNIIGGANAADRNIFSGNNFAGIEVADITTDYNQIIGNYIGTDITGSTALPNIHGLGFTTNPRNNLVDGNVISGNLLMGIYIYENCDSNTVINNKIGVAADGVTQLGNHSCGIFIANGASYNTIGNTTSGNTIAYNDTCGIAIYDATTKHNRISGNSIYSNGNLGIDIEPAGINYNDAGDTDDGANAMMNFPEITSSVYNSSDGITFIDGTIDTQNPQNCIIEIYKALPGPYSYGEGKIFLGQATPDASGNWSFGTSLLSNGDMITTLATDVDGSSSEFSLCSSVVVGIPAIIEKTTFRLYPNPANDYIIPDFYTDETLTYNLTIYNNLGLVEQNNPVRQGEKINILNLPAGVYSYSVKNRDMILYTGKIVKL